MRRRRRDDIIMEYGTYMLMFLASYIASLARLYYVSGILLIVEALYLYVHLARESENLVELRALFTLAWVGGQGLACLRLSRLQGDWSYVTWMCFFLAYIGFGIGYEWGRQYRDEEKREIERDAVLAGRLYLCIVGLFAVCIVFCVRGGEGRIYSAVLRQASRLFLFSCIGRTLFYGELYPDPGDHGAVP